MYYDNLNPVGVIYECESDRQNKKLISRWDSKRELSLRRHGTRTKNAIESLA